MSSRDLIVIGGGAAGLVVAAVAARLGLRVTLIEQRTALGGDCLHFGCVPSKSLIRAADVAHSVRTADELGLTATLGEADLSRIMARVRTVIDRLSEHDSVERFRALGCEIRFGTAAFADGKTVIVEGERLSGRRIVIATGSRPRVPTIPGLEEAAPLTNETLFGLDILPRHLGILGGGPVGCEMAQAFARLGSRVTLLQRNRQLLPRDDPEAAAAVAKALAAEGVDILTGATAQAIERGDRDVTVRYRNATGTTGTVSVDRILVATGREPDTGALDLAAAGVDTRADGIRVDRRMRTTQRHIYACGDVVGPRRFTHMAEYQAGLVLRNAVFRIPARSRELDAVHVTYTRPELAQAGLTESMLRARGEEPAVFHTPFAEVDRAVIRGTPEGFVKLLAVRGRLVGATVVGPHAGELIHELALAIRLRARPRNIAGTVHAYPTLGQAPRIAVNHGLAGWLERRSVQRVARFLVRRLP